MEAAYLELKERLAEINDLHKARSILGWDQQTMMPPQGGSVRAEQMATLDRVAKFFHKANRNARVRMIVDVDPISML